MNSLNRVTSVVIQILLFGLPWFLRRRFLYLFLGYDLASTSRIGISLVLASHVRMGSGSRIGHFNIIRNLTLLDMDECAKLGNFNKVGGVLPSRSGSFSGEEDRFPSLLIGRHASVTNSHILDCTSQIEIGEFATVAGWRSQILTHSIDFAVNRQRSRPVNIGRYCFVGTGCIVLKGAVLPEKSILAAGSVLTVSGDQPSGLYSGVPAVWVRSISPSDAYFARSVGRVI